MSNTTIFAVEQNEAPIVIGSTTNAWRSAMYVWSDISKRYFGLEGFPHFDEEMQSRVWNAGNEKPLTKAELIVLAATMDKAVTNYENIPVLVKAFEEYGIAHPNSSIGEQAVLIKERATKIPDGCSLAWIQTSVCGDGWFSSYPEDSEFSVCDLSDSFDVIEQCESLLQDREAA